MTSTHCGTEPITTGTLGSPNSEQILAHTTLNAKWLQCYLRHYSKNSGKNDASEDASDDSDDSDASDDDDDDDEHLPVHPPCAESNA